MSSTRVRSPQQGFTLIELLAVLGVLGMVLFFVLPNLDNISPAAKLRSHARRLALTIELAQGEAAGTGKEFVLAYDLNKGAYWVILPLPDPSPSPSPSPKATQNKNTNGTNGTNGTTETVDAEIPVEDAEHGLTPDLSSEQASGSNGSNGSSTSKTNGSSSSSSTSKSSSSTSNSNLSQRDTLPEEVLPDEVMIQSVTPLNGKQAESGMIYIPFSALGDEGSHIVVIQLKHKDGGGGQSLPPISIRFNALTRTVDFSNEKLGWQSISGN